jgi:hypothetical protein
LKFPFENLKYNADDASCHGSYYADDSTPVPPQQIKEDEKGKKTDSRTDAAKGSRKNHILPVTSILGL